MTRSKLPAMLRSLGEMSKGFFAELFRGREPLSLVATIVLSVLPITITAIVVLAWFTSHRARETARVEIHERLRVSAEYSGRALGSGIGRIQDDSERIVSQLAKQNSATIHELLDNWEAEHQLSLEPAMRGGRLLITDASGFVVASRTYSSETPSSDVVPMDIHERAEWIRNMLDRGEASIRATVHGILIGLPMLNSNGDIAGAVVRTSAWQEVIDSLPLIEHPFFIKKQGTILFSSDPDIVSNGRLEDSNPASYIQAGADIPATDLQIVVLETKDVAFAGIANLELTLWVAMVGNVLVLLIGIVFAGRLATRPLVELQSTIAHVRSDREQGGQIEASGSTEIRDLARELNELLADLLHSTVSRDYLERIVESVSEALLVIDSDERIELANPAAGKLLGLPAKELVGVPFADICPAPFENDPRSITALLRESESGSIEQRKTHFLACDGTTIAVLFAAATLRPRSDGDRTFGDSKIVCTGLDIRDLEHANSQLALTAERLELALEGANVGIWEWHVPTGDVYVSDTLVAQLGENEKWTELSDWVDHIHSEDREHVMKYIDQYLSGTSPNYINRFRLRHRNGSWRWIHSRGRAICDPDGKPVRVMGVHVDATEREEVEQQLARMVSELALPRQSVFEPGKHPFVLKDLSLADLIRCGETIRSMSVQARNHRDFAQRLTQYLYRQFLGESGEPAFGLVRFYSTRQFGDLSTTLRELVPADTPETATCLELIGTAGDKRAWNDREQSHEHQVIPLGDRQSVAKAPLIANAVARLGIEVAGVNVQHETNVSLLEGDGPTLLYVNQLSESLLIADREFVVERGLRSCFGFGDRLPNGQAFVVICFSKVAVARDLVALFGHLVESTRMTLLRFLEVDKKVEHQIQSLDRLLRRHEAIVIDQEAKLREALDGLAESNQELERSNRELDQFAYVASHDLKAPLRAIQNLSQWIEEDAGHLLPSGSKDHLEKLLGRVQRMERLLEDLLLYSRAGRVHGSLRQVDLAEMLAETIELLDPPSTFTFKVPDDLPTLTTYVTPLDQVLRNSISNAIKHHDRADGHIEVECKNLGSHFEFSISDDGPGIAPEYHERVFGMFQTLVSRDRVEGSGMGLAVIKRIVESYGGTVTLESAEGTGTTLRFTWPKSVDQGSSSSPSDEPMTAAHAS